MAGWWAGTYRSCLIGDLSVLSSRHRCQSTAECYCRCRCVSERPLGVSDCDSVLSFRFAFSCFRLERATCAASGFGGGLLVLPALPHSTPDRHAVVRPCTPLALYSHYTCRQIQGIATSYMQLRAWPRRMQLACILIPCPWPRCSPSPPSPPRQLRAGHDSSSPRLSRGRRPPCPHSTAARPGPTDRHYSDR